jgi:hypothetical protein
LRNRYVLSPSDVLPDDAPVWVPAGAIPPALRQFGRFLDTEDWWPGDVLLTKDRAPDYFTNKIIDYQVKGGYASNHAQWTHAAMYVGDDSNVCEATIADWRFWRGKVVVTSLFNYCGGYDLRLRRSKHIDTPRKGWRMVAEAMTQIGKPYDMGRILEIATAVNGKEGFWTNNLFPVAKNRAQICSTLFADSHNKVTSFTVGDKSGICVPAYLSRCSDLTDIPLQWTRIVDE